MKANKIIIAALGLITLGGLSSCSESWLDVDSKTESNSGNYYKTQEDGYRLSSAVTTDGSAQFHPALSSHCSSSQRQ